MRRIAAAMGALVILGMQLGPIESVSAADDPGHTGGKAPAAPQGRDYNYSLSPEGFASVFGLKESGKLTITLPHLTVFDRQGHLLLDLAGYHEDLAKLLKKMTKTRKPTQEGRSLAAVLSEMWTIDRQPPMISDLSDADYYFVMYGAEWCVPCKAELKDAQTFAEANPKRRINMVHVEADIAKLDAEMQKRLFELSVRAPKS